MTNSFVVSNNIFIFMTFICNIYKILNICDVYHKLLEHYSNALELCCTIYICFIRNTSTFLLCKCAQSITLLGYLSQTFLFKCILTNFQSRLNLVMLMPNHSRNVSFDFLGATISK